MGRCACARTVRLVVTELLEVLAPFHPLVAGTFPLGIHTDSSDLDVLCEVHDFAQFVDVVTRAFGACDGFTVNEPVVTFVLHGTPVELFAQNVPAYAQHGFRHLVVEARLLRLGGAVLRERVVALKRAGVKTEPAFAEVLRLSGDPYEALLTLEAASDERLRELLNLK